MPNLNHRTDSISDLRPAAGEGIHIPRGIKADVERGVRRFWAKRGGEPVHDLNWHPTNPKTKPDKEQP